MEEYIVGDHVPEAWLKSGQEINIAASPLKRVAADTIRLCISLFGAPLALRKMGTPDWVYERCGAFMLFGYLFQRRGIPWILETNLIMCEELVSDRRSVAFPMLVRWAETFAYERCDILVVISDDLKHAIIKKLGVSAEKIVVLPNAADTETFNPTVAVRRLFPMETFVIGFQGSMYKWAGLDYLIRAVASMREQNLDVAAVLLGDGHERASLEALASKLGVSEFVAFPGLVPRDKVPEYIAGYDIGFSGQINLTNNAMYLSPLKLYDYMAVAKPVIASRFPDAIGLTRDGEIGYLFNPEDQTDLNAAAVRAYHSRSALTEMGIAARAEVLRNHSWRSRIGGFIDIVDNMLRSRKRTSDK